MHENREPENAENTSAFSLDMGLQEEIRKLMVLLDKPRLGLEIFSKMRGLEVLLLLYQLKLCRMRRIQRLQIKRIKNAAFEIARVLNNAGRKSLACNFESLESLIADLKNYVPQKSEKPVEVYQPIEIEKEFGD